MDVMLDLICMEPVDLPEGVEKIQNEKFFPTVEFEPITEIWWSTNCANQD